MSAQILQFPKEKIIRKFHLSDEDKLKITNKQKREFAEYMLNELTQHLYATLEDFEFDVNNIALVKDLSFTIDSVRATIYRSLGLDHPLHAFTDKFINLIDKIDNENERETKG